jgi:hypothetical protein
MGNYMPRTPKPLTNDQLVNKLMRAVQRYVKASIAESWKGSGDPADIPDIDSEHREACDAYLRALHDVRIRTHQLDYMQKGL